jgi:type VI secretion system protein ImpE
MEKPKNLRDLLWATVRVATIDGTIGEVFMPVLYPSSYVHSNDQVRLGRMTDWKEIGEGLYQASGMKLFLVDDQDRALLEVNNLEFDKVQSGSEPS